jgi:hypothetical protein
MGSDTNSVKKRGLTLRWPLFPLKNKIHVHLLTMKEGNICGSSKKVPIFGLN